MGYGYKNRKSKKPLKKTSTRDIAKRALAKAKELDKESECKWYDQFLDTRRLRLCRDVVPGSVINLTNVPPLTATTFSGTPPAAQTVIQSYSKREGAKIHISGVYGNVQFYWPAIQDSSTLRYPPFAEIQWCVVKQKKSPLAVDVTVSSPDFPIPSDVYQDDDDIPLATQGSQPLGTMLFKSMRNGHNYKVLAEGRFTLPAPLATNINSGELVQAAVGTSMGEIPNMASETAAPETKPTQMSNNVVKRVKFRLHPNCKTRYEPTEQGSDEGDTNKYTMPLENGIYFMAWTDTGTSALGRWIRPAGATWNYEGPLMTANFRTRFTDS